MADPEISIAPADARRFVATDDLVWFSEPCPHPAEQQLVGIPADGRFGAEIAEVDHGDTYAGVYGSFPMRLAVPGPGPRPRLVPCGGLTWVGVHPDHRRKGVLTAMMRDHVERLHAAGVPLSALHASEPGIYARHGYGLACQRLAVLLGRGATLTAPQLEEAAAAMTTELATVTDPGMPERMRRCHLGAAPVGSVVGEPGYYERVCTQFPEELRDKEPWRILFARRDGEDVGLTMFRRTHKWEKSRPSGELEVWALLGNEPARLALLRRLVEFDLMGSVKLASVGVDDPVLHWAGGPRAASDVAVYDATWVRLVDLPGAMAQRAWSASCDVVVDVTDAAASWNSGLWRLRADGHGVASAERTDAEADLRLDVAALGAAYLGGGNLEAMRRAGHVEERRPGAVAELWRAMRTDVAPVPAVDF